MFLIRGEGVAHNNFFPPNQKPFLTDPVRFVRYLGGNCFALHLRECGSNEHHGFPGRCICINVFFQGE